MRDRDVRADAIENLKKQADDVLAGKRDHIEVKHIDALRILGLIDDVTTERDGLKRQFDAMWERSVAMEVHIEALGSTVEAAQDAATKSGTRL